MKEDIKLPAIIDNVGYNQKVLIFKCGKAYHLEGDYEGEWSNEEYYIESQCKNITPEYLANTYGKAESKEHAEFIVELAEVNKLKIDSSVSRLGGGLTISGFALMRVSFTFTTELNMQTTSMKN